MTNYLHYGQFILFIEQFYLSKKSKVLPLLQRTILNSNMKTKQSLNDVTNDYVLDNICIGTANDPSIMFYR